MKPGRVFAFAGFVVGGGLLQLWVLVAILQVTRSELKLATLLGDGGLFFFATSTAVASAITLFDNKGIQVGKVDFNVTWVVCGGILFVTVVYYAAVLSEVGVSDPKPFAKYIPLQLGCATMAIVYWFYTGVRVGLFTKK
jgi:hypothetical protein